MTAPAADAILNLLVATEDLAYLITDPHLTINHVSAGAANYGLTGQGSLYEAPAWLAGLVPRMIRLFERPSVLKMQVPDHSLRMVAIHAQAITLNQQASLLITLRRLAHTHSPDPMDAPYHQGTGLYGSAFMSFKIEEELARMRRYPSTFSLLALHVEPADRRLEQQIADLCRIHCRAVDIIGLAPNGDFLILMPGTTHSQVQHAGERLSTLIEDWRFDFPTPVRISYTGIEANKNDTPTTLLTHVATAVPIHT